MSATPESLLFIFAKCLFLVKEEEEDVLGSNDDVDVKEEEEGVSTPPSLLFVFLFYTF
jgi:hypothetical protein